MDALIGIARQDACSMVFLRSEVPAEHPSASVLGEERMGSGVAVAPDRVLTAHYLVLGARSVTVTGIDGKERPVTRVGLDHETGLALLHVEEAAFPALSASPAAARPGMPVFLLGHTAEGERRGASGHVCLVGPFEAFWEYMLDRAIMTTAVNPGLAGAGLFDSTGRLLGIVSLGLATVGRYSLAIPVELYLQARADLERGERGPGRPRRAWVGFYPQGQQGNVVIAGVVPGGPADRAGLERGDLIVSLDGEPVASVRELYSALWRRAPGESLGLQVLRESTMRQLDVVAGDRDEFYR